jgi:hypothetical protein
MDYFTQLDTDIQLSLSSHLSLIAAIYDLRSAFDKVHIPTLTQKLSNLGVPNSICILIHKYLINRTVIVKGTDGFATPRTTSGGVPQGSVLSPLLFLVYTINISEILTSSTEMSAYAEDLVVYSKGTTPEACIRNLEVVNQNLPKCLEKAHLTINPVDSEFMVYT